VPGAAEGVFNLRPSWFLAQMTAWTNFALAPRASLRSGYQPPYGFKCFPPGPPDRPANARDHRCPVLAPFLAVEPHGGYHGQSSRSSASASPGDRAIASTSAGPTPRQMRAAVSMGSSGRGWPSLAAVSAKSVISGPKLSSGRSNPAASSSPAPFLKTHDFTCWLSALPKNGVRSRRRTMGWGLLAYPARTGNFLAGRRPTCVGPILDQGRVGLHIPHVAGNRVDRGLKIRQAHDRALKSAGGRVGRSGGWPRRPEGWPQQPVQFRQGQQP